MADDKVEILGRWRVTFRDWKWEYVFNADGSVRWRDPLNNENGAGRWALTQATVYVSWSKSKTKESWNRPVKQKGQSGYIDADYGKGNFAAEKLNELVLPNAQGNSDEIDLELDPATGDFVQTDPKKHGRYIERVFTAVAYGILPDGYYVYADGMELPILLPEHMVDFGLGSADSERSRIFDSFDTAKAAANDSPGRRRVAYFWGAGGAVVSPTIIGPATTPALFSTIVTVRDLRDQFVSIMLPAITLAIGMISGPQPMTVKGNQGSGRIAKKRGGNVPPRNNPVPRPAVGSKIKPLNGQVSVGGGFENRNGSNLNPINPRSGGPAKDIPNHVLGGMEDMADKFEPGSVKRMISSRLRYQDVDWAKGTEAASRVMAPGSKVSMNVWCQGAEERQAVKAAFEAARFKNVRVVGDGTGTMVFADF
jgi:hypothetical protein